METHKICLMICALFLFFAHGQEYKGTKRDRTLLKSRPEYEIELTDINIYGSDGQVIGQRLISPSLGDADLSILHHQNHFECDILLPDRKISPRSGAKNVWPDQTIPYQIHSIYDKDQIRVILDAMKSFESKTCLRFINRTTERDYIHIYPAKNKGCCSFVGKIGRGGGQMLSLNQGCLTPEITKHELMHSIGFYHEQSRTDRDKYVNIHRDNIIENAKFNFKMYDNVQVQLRTPYDYRSIMHYASNTFAKNSEKPTISAKNGATIGPTGDFTETDILDINRLYNCPNISG